MALGYGLVAAAAQLGLEAILIRPKRAISNFTAQVTLTERHVDEMDIVDHPVEQGAQISDHAYMRPPEVIIECAWSNTPRPSGGFLGSLSTAMEGTNAGVQSIITGNSPNQVRDVYQKLLQLQASRVLIEVVTGKRTYVNMLVRSLIVETDKQTENVLKVTVTLRQLLIASVRVGTIAAAKEDQAFPETTQSSADKGVVQLGVTVRSLNTQDLIMALTPTVLDYRMTVAAPPPFFPPPP